MAVDMANEKLITKEEAVMRIKPEDIERLFYPVIDPKVDRKALQSKILGTGINAVPGAAVGKVVFSAPTTPKSGPRRARRSSSSAAKPAPKTSAAWPSRKAFSPPPAARPVTPPSSRAAGASAASSAPKSSTLTISRRR